MKINLFVPTTPYLNDLPDIVRAFSPHIEISETADDFLRVEASYQNGIFSAEISSSLWGNDTANFAVSDGDSLTYKKLTKRFLKNRLYLFLSKNLKVTLPYGSLTGVRPTKLFIEKGAEALEKDFFVAPSRVRLIGECVKNQIGVRNADEKNVGFFVNIPFCPSRCHYCSFISTEVFRVQKRLPAYVSALIYEIEEAKKLIAKKGFKVSSVYVGGGSPASIGEESLDKILRAINFFDVEFTVEIGRPDTFSAEIIEVLKRNSVTRVSVNPQTFRQKTLDEIGRKHTIEQFYAAFNLAKKAGFDINIDLIAGLKNETLDDFKHSLNSAISLSPENITVHTLCVKRGSILKETGGVEVGASAMIDFAVEKLCASNYSPYYMYRQKNMSDNLENTGFCLDKKQCKYNVDIMEECASIVACGAGSVSKLISGDKIERFSSPKGFNEYVERIEDTARRKAEFFK